MKNIKNTSKIFYFLLISLVLVLVVFAFYDTDSNKQRITTSQAEEYFKDDKVVSWYVVGNSKIVFDLKEGTETWATISSDQFPKKYDCFMAYNSKIIDAWINGYADPTDTTKIISHYDLYLDSEPPAASIWETLYPIIMIALALIFIFFLFKMFSSKGNGAMGFGKSRARNATNIKVKFSDIAGAEEEKEELREIVDFLKSPGKFTELGARIPKGVLLVGPPGTGKTLLARAVAGESGVPFLSISGSDFVEMFVGVGASRVRDLFEQAKRSAPCIIFIDEIDAVGRQRGAGLGGSNDEREQTLNQLLVELDGFEANQGIIVLAATNRSDVLDPALMRPGRFDRQVYVYPPDVKGREGIIKIHARNKPLASDVDFQTLARITSGLTGADIENMLNEAAILAARANHTKITMVDITEGLNKAMMGPKKVSAVVTENDKKITAYHEAGHAVIGKVLNRDDDVQEVSIIPRGQAAGYTMSRPLNDDKHLSKSKLNDLIVSLMGGRVAEELALKEICTGASNDIERATNIARKMVTEWGMSEKFGFMNFGTEGQVFIGRDYQSKNIYSEETAAQIDKEIKQILDNNYARAKKIISENMDKLEDITKLLFKRETIYKHELDLLFAGKSVEEILTELDKKDKERKTKEAKEKKNQEKENKLREIEMKVKTSEVFLKHGIITEKEYQDVLKLRDTIKNDLENKKSKTKSSQIKMDLETDKEENKEQKKEADKEPKKEIKKTKNGGTPDEK